MTEASFSPLVVGSPRSGFALLCSILAHFTPMARPKVTLRRRVLGGLIDAFGGHVANEVARVIAEAGLADDMVYSPAFRKMTGGPKWLHHDDPASACYRKYVGVRGLGDFTLITAHPRETLDYDDVLHCHVDASRWLAEPAYADCQKFASVRNPIGIINSSMFSLNALTSEYIQKFVRPEDDTHELRERLALFKFTNLDFFEGLVTFYRKWFDDFIPVRDGYTVMRWEDLLTDPHGTIRRLAERVGLPVDDEHAGQIWAALGHGNLTESHKHNFRPGGGVVGGWKSWITNRHLDILRAGGFDEVLATFGYDAIPVLDEGRYTPFQRRVDDLLAKGLVFDDYPDRTLFGFAFNKSNMDSSKFAFKRYGWKTTTQVERSDFSNEDLMLACWDAADDAAARLNTVFRALLAERWDDEAGSLAALVRVRAAAAQLAGHLPKAFDAVFPSLDAMIREWFAARERGAVAVTGAPPRLIRAVGRTNVVGYQGRFYGIPQSAGALDLSRDSVERCPGVVVGETYADVISAVAAPRKSLFRRWLSKL